MYYMFVSKNTKHEKGETMHKPTAEQIQALVEYAKANGRTWKSKLNDAWYHASEAGILQQIRNEFGPSWLMRFKLPKEGA
jgi:hypothetical protein